MARKKLTVRREGYHRKGYTRKDGTKVSPAYVPPATFKAEDRGKPGRTPKSKRWYKPTTTMNWSKDMPIADRRINALKAHGKDVLATARALQALANVTTDTKTKKEAQKDADWAFDLYRTLNGRKK